MLINAHGSDGPLIGFLGDGDGMISISLYRLGDGIISFSATVSVLMYSCFCIGVRGVSVIITLVSGENAKRGTEGRWSFMLGESAYTTGENCGGTSFDWGIVGGGWVGDVTGEEWIRKVL